MRWEAVTQTMLQSSDGKYQISRGPIEAGKFTYRAWFRSENKILETVQCFDEVGDRAAAVEECKAACLQHSGVNKSFKEHDDGN